MSQTWYSEDTPEDPPLGIRDWLRVIRRGVPLAVNTFGCLVLLLLLRLIERPLFGARRPLTPWITQYVCRSAFVILGMGYRVEGRPLDGPGAVVANHSSWLDIFSLNAPQRIYFVSKAEVAGWPGIGWLARATSTLFIRRNRSEAQAHAEQVKSRLALGHRLLFFPEGTSTDGLRVLPFRSTLFSAFFAEDMPRSLAIQPVTVVYTAPEGHDPRFYGWWGEMTFDGHLLKTLSAREQGSVRVIFHAPVAVADLANRKEAAQTLFRIVAGPIEARSKLPPVAKARPD
ncbi:MAG: lysophospholipid acyltransferase family protein [Pseudomonadota bacterium]